MGIRDLYSNFCLKFCHGWTWITSRLFYFSFKIWQHSFQCKKRKKKKTKQTLTNSLNNFLKIECFKNIRFILSVVFLNWKDAFCLQMYFWSWSSWLRQPRGSTNFKYIVTTTGTTKDKNAHCCFYRFGIKEMYFLRIDHLSAQNTIKQHDVKFCQAFEWKEPKDFTNYPFSAW